MSITSDLRLNGLNPLAYQGVNPYTPVPFFTLKRDPTVNDYQNFTLGTVWLNQSNEVAWMLVNLNRVDAITTVATWIPFASGHPNLQALQGNTGGLVFATATIPPYINVIGDGIGISIAGNPGTHTLTASLVGGGVAAQSFVGDTGAGATPTATGVLNVIAGLATNNSGSTVSIGANTHTLELSVTDVNQNTTIGNLSGNTALTGIRNTCLGYLTGNAITNARGNTLIGDSAGSLITTGIDNVAIGDGALKVFTTGAAGAGANTCVGTLSGNLLTTGIHNTLIGDSAGSKILSGNFNLILDADGSTSNYTGAESDNIIIGNDGIVGESNKIRIGTYGTGNGQQNQAYMVGIVTFPQQPSFGVYLGTDVTNATGDGTDFPIIYDTVAFDIGSNYNTGTGRFTAPLAGTYCFAMNCTTSNFTSSMTGGLWSISVSGTGPWTGVSSMNSVNPFAVQKVSNGAWTSAGSANIYMNAGDSIAVVVRISGGTKTATVNGGAGRANWFTGCKVS